MRSFWKGQSMLVALVVAGSGLAQYASPPPAVVAPQNAPQPPALPAPQPVPVVPLGLGDVLASVDRHYPLVRAAEQQRIVAAGDFQSAEGAFDLNLRAFESTIGGSYASQRAGVGVDQAIPLFGASLSAGWRLGQGNFPVYYGDRATAQGGEFSAALILPLLRDRATDKRRATLQKANLDRQIAEPVIQLQRIDIARAASVAYWNWVATGQQYLIAQQILGLAKKRDQQLAELVGAQKVAPIVRTDNQRLIVDREAKLVAAFRQYQQAALALSLYYRDTTGARAVPVPAQLPVLPEIPPPPSTEQRGQDLNLALLQRPELQRLRLQREKLEVDLRLAENQQLPGVNMALRGAQDVGSGKKDLDRYTYEAALGVDVPLQRRDAKGRALSARAAMAQVMAQEQFARDKITTELSDLLSALERAYELRERGREMLRLAKQMQEAENELFLQNKSNLIFLNLRELATAEARVVEISALAQYLRALAEYQSALGIDLSQPLVNGAPGSSNPLRQCTATQ